MKFSNISQEQNLIHTKYEISLISYKVLNISLEHKHFWSRHQAQSGTLRPIRKIPIQVYNPELHFKTSPW